MQKGVFVKVSKTLYIITQWKNLFEKASKNAVANILNKIFALLCKAYKNKIQTQNSPKNNLHAEISY
jgi:hypothetical protein